jgi:hypothetical protein
VAVAVGGTAVAVGARVGVGGAEVAVGGRLVGAGEGLGITVAVAMEMAAATVAGGTVVVGVSTRAPQATRSSVAPRARRAKAISRRADVALFI